MGLARKSCYTTIMATLLDFSEDELELFLAGHSPVETADTSPVTGLQLLADAAVSAEVVRSSCRRCSFESTRRLPPSSWRGGWSHNEVTSTPASACASLAAYATAPACAYRDIACVGSHVSTLLRSAHLRLAACDFGRACRLRVAAAAAAGRNVNINNAT